MPYDKLGVALVINKNDHLRMTFLLF
jgi:hypothetical protein